MSAASHRARARDGSSVAFSIRSLASRSATRPERRTGPKAGRTLQRIMRTKAPVAMSSAIEGSCMGGEVSRTRNLQDRPHLGTICRVNRVVLGVLVAAALGSLGLLE